MKKLIVLAITAGALAIPVSAQASTPETGGPQAQASGSHFWAKPHYIGRPTRRQINQFIDRVDDGRALAGAASLIFATGGSAGLPGILIAGLAAVGADRIATVTRRALRDGRGPRPVRFDAGVRCGDELLHQFPPIPCYDWFTARARK